MPAHRVHDQPMTSGERTRRSRAQRGERAIALPGETLEQLDAIRARDGDASLTATVQRLVREATGDAEGVENLVTHS